MYIARKEQRRPISRGDLKRLDHIRRDLIDLRARCFAEVYEAGVRCDDASMFNGMLSYFETLNRVGLAANSAAADIARVIEKVNPPVGSQEEDTE